MDFSIVNYIRALLRIHSKYDACDQNGANTKEYHHQRIICNEMVFDWTLINMSRSLTQLFIAILETFKLNDCIGFFFLPRATWQNAISFNVHIWENSIAAL